MTAVPLPWQPRSACRTAPPDLFHPDDPNDPDPDVRALCAACPAHDDCLEHALVHEVGERDVGIWAGLTLRERRNLRRRRQRAHDLDVARATMNPTPRSTP